MLLRILIFITALMPLYLSTAQAVVKDGTVIPNETLEPLVEWVEDNTHIQINTLPIVTASNAELKSALKLKDVQHAHAAAIYVPGQIIISNSIWDPESLLAKSYLVHELVHHAQLLSRAQYPCHAAKEKEAYTLQNRWLVEQGGEPLVTGSWIEKMSACAAGNEYDAKNIAAFNP